MNTILEKLGIYDLIAVLLSGISISTVSLLVLQVVYNVPDAIDFQVNETLTFLLICYIIGLLFQEIGSWIQRRLLFDDDKLLRTAFGCFNDAESTSGRKNILCKLIGSLCTLTEKNDSRICLDNIERDSITAYVKNKLNVDSTNISVLYNYCKYKVINKFDTARIDRDHSIGALSRSLALYFLLLCLFSFFSTIGQFCILRIMLVFVSAFLCAIMFFRCIRFIKMRYVNIFRTFYYQVIKADDEKASDAQTAIYINNLHIESK